MILPKFPENCMILRKFWAGGGGVAPGADDSVWQAF